MQDDKVTAICDWPTSKNLAKCRQVLGCYMNWAHSGMCGGHLVLRHTLDQVQRRAFWFGWRRDIRRFYKQCSNCNGYFRGQLPRSEPLQPMLTGAPLEMLYIDVTGPHPRSRRGSVFIVTCIDPFTKWAEEAATIARIIVEHVICRFGIPLSIVTDRAKELELMRAICQLLEVDKLRTTVYKAISCRSRAFPSYHE